GALDLVRIGVLDGEAAHLVVHEEELVDAGAALVAGVEASVATLGAIDLARRHRHRALQHRILDLAAEEGGRVEAERDELVLGRRRENPALGADAADEPLRHERDHRRDDAERLYAHDEEAGKTA